MAEVESIPGFNLAAEYAKASKVSVSFSARARGYGLFKVGTTGVAPSESDKPGILSIERRQKWFAWEAAWKEVDGDYKKAQELYIVFVEETNNFEAGHFKKQSH